MIKQTKYKLIIMFRENKIKKKISNYNPNLMILNLKIQK
jgi:hypothetical protein